MNIADAGNEAFIRFGGRWAAWALKAKSIAVMLGGTKLNKLKLTPDENGFRVSKGNPKSVTAVVRLRHVGQWPREERPLTFAEVKVLDDGSLIIFLPETFGQKKIVAAMAGRPAIPAGAMGGGNRR